MVSYIRMYTLLLLSNNKQQPQGKHLVVPVTARRPQDSCMGSNNSEIPAG